MTIEVTSVQPKRRWPRRRPVAATELRERAAHARRLKRLFQLFAAIVVILIVSAACIVGYFYSYYSKIVDERLASGYLTSRAGIYAAPRVLRAGQNISRERLVEILRRAGYVDGEASRVWSGRFAFEGGDILIQPRRANPGAMSFETVRVAFDRRGRIAEVTGDGSPLAAYALEPEPLTNDAAMKTGQRSALAYGDIPPVLARAILSIEDRRFFEHSGLDITGIVRALLSWCGRGGDGGEQDFKQGGSTITQQLVKNTYLTPERTLRRKFNEAILAGVLERRLSKQDILALYCDEIYLGQRGSVAVRGVAQAARVFFGRELKDLSLAEAATIAGMIQSPGRYAPDRHPDHAQLRRNTVIEAMLRDGAITPEQARAAAAEPVVVAPAREESATAPYFIDYVNRASESRAGSANAADERAPRVYTTIDLELQQLAEVTVRRQLERLDKIFKGKRTPQAALVALDPQNGNVLAMVGGKTYAVSQLNRATDARRQPGSVFKPIVYAAAMEGGISPLSNSLDAPREFTYDVRAKYRPANYGGNFSMRDVTLRHALVHSLNVVTVDTALRAGLSLVAALAENLGLPRPEAYPSLALGTTEATPLEVAAAYSAFANGGRVVRPDVINEGTARAARGALKGTAIAGKTGTSRDGWFAGYTPNLVCVVWVGFDDGQELGLTGAESALPAWTEFVRGAVELRPELGGEHFVRPEGVTFVEIDPETGALAGDACPRRQRVAVTPAFAPGAECLTHRPPLDTLAPAEVAELNVQASPVVQEARQSAVVSATTATPRQRLTARVPSSVTVMEMPAVHATAIEVTRGGRQRLTNELRASAASLP
ncbi:MAG: transglycosylase domain-containing protein [Acidobacteria bacterium]|nr:transglycosylase domain-containing protein [Acidobacteriota bacterium]